MATCYQIIKDDSCINISGAKESDFQSVRCVVDSPHLNKYSPK